MQGHDPEALHSTHQDSHFGTSSGVFSEFDQTQAMVEARAFMDVGRCKVVRQRMPWNSLVYQACVKGLWVLHEGLKDLPAGDAPIYAGHCVVQNLCVQAG